MKELVAGWTSHLINRSEIDHGCFSDAFLGISSAREGAVQGWGIPAWMAGALPQSVEQCRSHLSQPPSTLHSDADHANPMWMGEHIYQAAPEPKQFVMLHGLPHNAAYKGAIEQWWTPVITFIQGAEELQ